MRIDTGHIITACKVRDEHGYEHPKHRDTRPSKDRKAPRGFRFADLVKIDTVKGGKKKGLLSWILKWA